MPGRKISYKEYVEAVSKISEALTSDLYLDDILKLIVTVTANVMKAKICGLWLLNDKDQSLTIAATQSMSSEYLKERSLKVGEGIVGLVAEERKPVAIADVLKDERFREKELARREGLVSMLSVPMMVKERVKGVVNCYTTFNYEFSAGDIDLLSTVANQAGVAIENAELLTRVKLLQDELQTRKKIEKAKGILIRRKKISEEDAYNLIREASMAKRIPMKEISEAIILSEEVAGA